MTLRFTKMHGLGNDFVVIDGYTQPIALTREQLQKLADRHFGVGCDQILLVEKATHAENDFRYRIFNADGGEVNQCGNGARCFALYVRDRQLTKKNEIAVETVSGVIYPKIEREGQVTVNMGIPNFDPQHIPFIANHQATKYTLELADQSIEIGAVSMGNPHAVLLVDDVDDAPVKHLGPAIERHERFPERVNVGFAQLVSRKHLRLRVFERGVGETLACGTGACAAVAVCRQRKLVDDTVSVNLRGGTLRIFWPAHDQPLLMTGPATYVFEGTIDL